MADSQPQPELTLPEALAEIERLRALVSKYETQLLTIMGTFEALERKARDEERPFIVTESASTTPR